MKVDDYWDKIRPRVGMRTFKTALSVALGLYLSDFLNLDSPVFVAIACIVTIQPSFSETFSEVRLRIFTSVIGVILGYVFSLVTSDPWLQPLVVGLGAIVTTTILLKLKFKRMIKLTLIIFMASYFAKSDKLLYAVNRVLGTLLGIGVAMLVNFFISSPNIEDNFKKALKKTYHDIMEMTRGLLINQIPLPLGQLEKDIDQLNTFYKLLVEEDKQPLSPGHSLDQAKDLIQSYERVFFYLSLINLMKEDYPHLTLNNRRLVEDLFHVTIFYDGTMDGGKNIVYNHYIQNLLQRLKRIQMLQEEVVTDD